MDPQFFFNIDFFKKKKTVTELSWIYWVTSIIYSTRIIVLECVLEFRGNRGIPTAYLFPRVFHRISWSPVAGDAA